MSPDEGYVTSLTRSKRRGRAWPPGLRYAPGVRAAPRPANFADRRIEHHATMTDGDSVLIWAVRDDLGLLEQIDRAAG